MLTKIFEKLFYNPIKIAKKYANIEINPNAVLLKEVRFRMNSDSNVIKIGKDTMVGCSFIFESDQGEIKIGENTFINGGTSLISRERIDIGSNVTIAWGCTIYDHNSHSLDFQNRRNDITVQLKSYRAGISFIEGKNWATVKAAEIVIKNDVWIGFGCTILKGVTLGEGSIIGAQSVVRKDVEPWTVVAGNPAVFIRNLK